MVTLSFRLPEPVRDLFLAQVTALVAEGDSGIENQTDALQDAVVKWMLLEGVQ